MSADSRDPATRLDAAVVRLQERVASAGADPGSVRLVAVTKGHPVETIRLALDAGLVDLGESYAQELVAKTEALDDEPPPVRPRWHAIGGLQRNKVRLIAPFVHLWQAVDRLSLAGEIARRAPGASVLVQVNVSGAEQQGGCRPTQVASVVEGCRDLGLDVQGLMAIGARGAPDAVRAGFRQVRALADGLELRERSMGMSGDLELAVAEGSTMVRVGTDLFGPRVGAAGVGK
jgi:PLP dependent protein